MTAVAAVAPRPQAAAPTLPAPRAAAVARLYLRLVRRSALLTGTAMVVYLVVEVLAFRAAYPDAGARDSLLRMADNAAVRMLQGVPHGIDDTGAYVVWDAGWMIHSIVALWAIVLTTRLLRAEEDTDRVALVLSAPVAAGRALTAQLGVLFGSSVLVGGLSAAALVATGTGLAGSLLFGAGLVGSAAVFVGVAAVTSQLAGDRRRALGMAAGVLGAAFALRMVAYSGESRAWLRFATPYGWADELRPFDANHWAALALPAVTAVGLAVLAAFLRERRDAGVGLLAGRERTQARLRFLSGPIALSWRLNVGVLTGWLVGTVAYAAMVGALSPVATEFGSDDPDTQKMLERFGMEMVLTERGFVALLGPMLGLVLALYVCWRIGAAHVEEAVGHLDVLLAQPVARGRWIAGHALLAGVGALVLAVGAAAAIWISAALVGADVGPGDGAAALAAQLPLVLTFGGLALLLLGLAPRLTTTLPAALVVVAYLLQMLGPALGVPNAVVAVSPFHHLGYVPVEPLRVLPALILVAAGVVAAVGGTLAFHRRDIQ